MIENYLLLGATCLALLLLAILITHRLTQSTMAVRLAAANKEKEMLQSALHTARQEAQEQMREQRLAMQQQQERQMELFRQQLLHETQQLLLQRQEELRSGNRTEMGDIVRPLRESLSEMRLQLHTMTERALRLSDATTALTDAMRSNGKVQGDWGENILETILENSGMQLGVHYETQASQVNEAGQTQRPDVIVHCPGARDIIIDSKVSLTAYSSYISAHDKAEADQYEKENYDSLRRHVDELARKDYAKLDQKNLPQVLMFVPNEGSYILALRHDPSLGQKAFNRGVVILTPTNLMLTLELVSALWVNERKEKNVEKILATATTLYEKFCAFSDCFTNIHTSLEKAQGSYTEALRYLTTGKGNVVRQVEGLKELGIKYNKSKAIDAQLIDNESEE